MPNIERIVENFHKYRSDENVENKNRRVLSLLQLLNYRMTNDGGEIISSANKVQKKWGDTIMLQIDELAETLKNSRKEKFQYLKLGLEKQKILGIREITHSLWPGETEKFPLANNIRKILGGKSLRDAYSTKRKKSNLLSFLFKKRSSREDILNTLGNALDEFIGKPNDATLSKLKGELKSAQTKMNTEQSRRSYFKKSAMFALTIKINQAIEEFAKPKPSSRLEIS